MTEKQLDIVKGVFYGQAIGDALGLGTEFMTKTQIRENYPNGFDDYSQIIQDKHRKRWVIGSWTDDTDQFVCICESIIKTSKVDEYAFAEELDKWFKGTPMGIGNTVLNVIKLPIFLTDPYRASQFVYKNRKSLSASNGAVMRTSILGTFNFNNYEKVIEDAERIAKVTHWDSRCVGSSVIVSLIIATILQEGRFLSLSEIYKIGDSYDMRISEYLESRLCIDSLELDEPKTIGYTLKALSAGIWAYNNANSFEEGLLAIINEGGDADTNGCIAGSLLGAKFGYSAIPDKYINGLVNKDYLEELFNKYIKVIKL